MCDIAYKATLNNVPDSDFPPELIKHQLAHAVRDPLDRAYNRTKHLEQRREMMQAWADYLDELKGATTRKKPLKEGAEQMIRNQREKTAAGQAGLE